MRYDIVTAKISSIVHDYGIAKNLRYDNVTAKISSIVHDNGTAKKRGMKPTPPKIFDMTTHMTKYWRSVVVFFGYLSTCINKNSYPGTLHGNTFLEEEASQLFVHVSLTNIVHTLELYSCDRFARIRVHGPFLT